MNKKLLFAALSLAAFTACTDDNFESQKQLAEQTCPVEFELVNDATRASMYTKNYNNIEWTSDDHDLFTLYHGSVAPANVQDFDFKSGYENATYESSSDGTTAKLTTPTMIKQGRAIMVWPCDTTFRITKDDNLTLVIPAVQTNIENNIPYVSDLVNIAQYAEYSEEEPGRTDYNTAGYARKYPVYMRPMASQLNLKPNYIGQDKIDELKNLEEDPIEDITIDNIQLLTQEGGNDMFTKEIPLQFAAPAANQGGNWALAANHRAWDKVTAFDKANIAAAGKTATLTSSCFYPDFGICKFLFLPQADIAGGVDNAAIIVNTYYGQVVVARGDDVYGFVGHYTADELNNAWYRFRSDKPATEAQENEGEHTAAAKETTPDGDEKYRCSAAPAFGMQQTINIFSNYTVETQNHTSVVENEQQGIAYTRYLNVYLKYLDMKNLHIKSDKQLYDVVRVWKALGLDGVTVFLDDDKDANGAEDEDDDFHISQKTIEAINNANAGLTFDDWFTVKPCNVDGENIDKIVITGSNYKQEIQNLTFIRNNGALKASVVLADEGTTKPWKWTGDVKVHNSVKEIINEGTMQNAADATLRTVTNAGVQHKLVPLVNNGTWNIEGGKLFVQFNVTNNKVVNISSTAQYRQAGSVFTNEATTLPERFVLNDPSIDAAVKEVFEEQIGVVNNEGVFAVVDDNAEIHNYGLIEHKNVNAKTYITTNQTQGANFANAFATGEAANKMGRINLPYSNKNEDNISISADLAEGFVSITVSAADAPANGKLNEDVVGDKVNYVIINGGITSIEKLPANNQIKYVEIADPAKLSPNEIAWNLTDDPATANVDERIANYEGLIVLSDVNIKLHTTINVSKACYLGADMYVGGVFSNGQQGQQAGLPSWTGYYGNTTANFATKYVTYGN